MLFTEPLFLFVFLPLVLVFYFLIPIRSITYKNLVLFVSSVFFYAWGEGPYFLILIFSILVNYAIGVAIALSWNRWSRRLALAVAVVANLSLLLIFKYANFLTDNLNVALGLLGAGPVQVQRMVMPLGVSFFTFQGISYVVDVFRGEVQAARRPLDVAVFKSFFPQLIAGPIVRYDDVAEQIRSRRVSGDEFAAGVRRFIAGLGKKMLIANQMALPADQIFALPTDQLGPGLAWLGILCYTFQIYFDFSGYSDMAIGMGRMFGFHLPENFRYPYAAASITDFWRRWHMSLSSWFRDYLYIPLGGNRVSPLRVYLNLLAVFFLCGLWHGASWNFVVWGLFHGLFLVAERVGGQFGGPPVPWPLRHAYVVVVVMVGWVVFRTETMAAAGSFLAAMAGLGAGHAAVRWSTLNGLQWLMLPVAAIAALPWLVALDSLRRRLDLDLPALGLLVTGGEIALLIVSASFVAAQGYNPFIYFRF
jgi:alginate O-acetyltransferase complex protein AlgI